MIMRIVTLAYDSLMLPSCRQHSNRHKKTSENLVKELAIVSISSLLLVRLYFSLLIFLYLYLNMSDGLRQGHEALVILMNCS